HQDGLRGGPARGQRHDCAAAGPREQPFVHTRDEAPRGRFTTVHVTLRKNDKHLTLSARSTTPSLPSASVSRFTSTSTTTSPKPSGAAAAPTATRGGVTASSIPTTGLVGTLTWLLMYVLRR